jgi:hypothetical protein
LIRILLQSSFSSLLGSIFVREISHDAAARTEFSATLDELNDLGYSGRLTKTLNTWSPMNKDYCGPVYRSVLTPYQVFHFSIGKCFIFLPPLTP